MPGRRARRTSTSCPDPNGDSRLARRGPFRLPRQDDVVEPNPSRGWNRAGRPSPSAIERPRSKSTQIDRIAPQVRPTVETAR